MKKPIVRFQSTGPSGNIYYILGAARDALRKQSRINDYNEMRDKVLSSESYREALIHIREYVDLIDIDGKY